MEEQSALIVDRTDLARDVRRVSNLLGRAPSKTEYSQMGRYSPDVCVGRFGSWARFLEAAGLDWYAGWLQTCGGGKSELDDEDLIEDLLAGAVVLGRAPSSYEYQRCGDHCFKSIIRHFGSYEGALEAAGLDDDPTAEEIKRLYFDES